MEELAIRPSWFVQETQETQLQAEPLSTSVTVYKLIDSDERVLNSYKDWFTVEYLWTRQSSTFFNRTVAFTSQLCARQAAQLGKQLQMHAGDIVAKEALPAGFEFEWIGHAHSLQELNLERDLHNSDYVIVGNLVKWGVRLLPDTLGKFLNHAETWSTHCNAEILHSDMLKFPIVKLLKDVAVGDVIRADMRFCKPWLHSEPAAFDFREWGGDQWIQW